MQLSEDERTSLARIRTKMANERTLMSFYRTSFALIGVGAFIYKFYLSLFSSIIAGVMVLIGIIVAIYGYYRYKRYHKRIAQEMPEEPKK